QTAGSLSRRRSRGLGSRLVDTRPPPNLLPGQFDLTSAEHDGDRLHSLLPLGVRCSWRLDPLPSCGLDAGARSTFWESTPHVAGALRTGRGDGEDGCLADAPYPLPFLRRTGDPVTNSGLGDPHGESTPGPEVTSGSGTTVWPGRRSRWKRCSTGATKSCASVRAKLLPMHCRGPCPKSASDPEVAGSVRAKCGWVGASPARWARAS